MDDQTAVKNGSGRLNGVVGSLADLGNDIAALAELQAKLAAADYRESAELAALPAGVLAAGLAVLLGSIPVLLLGLAALLATWLKLSSGGAQVVVAVGAMVLAGAAVAVAARRLPRCFQSFRRSSDELSRNLAWIRTVLVHSGRTAPRRGS